MVILCLLLFAVGFWIMLRPYPRESEGFIPPAQAPNFTSSSYPESAHDMRWALSSRGLGGRFMAYRFSGTVSELKKFANSEMANSWNRPTVAVESNARSPFDADRLKDCGDTFGLQLDWMTAPKGARGSIYTGGRRSHVPVIFVDEQNGVLYYLVTD